MNGNRHYREDNSWVGFVLIFLAVLIIITLAIAAKVIVLVGILGGIIGLIMIIAGIHDEEGIIVIRGIIILVASILLIFFGNWLSGFLVDIGAIEFANNTLETLS